jgi:serine/threonine-protein kinase
VVKVTVSKGPEIVMVEIPSVTGDSQDEAINTLKEAGLKVSVEQEYHDEVESGDVIRQSPEAGEEVEIGTKVTIVVSKGSNKVSVPNLIGKTLTEASQALEERGLSLSSNYEEDYSDSIEAEHIMRQSIDADSSVELGTSVTVTLSKGKSTVTVPNLSGTKEDMERLIRDAGLTPNVTQEHSEAAAGTILSMSHSSGTAVAPGTTIDVVLSLGPKMVSVPQIVGSSQEAAEKALRDAELNVNVKDRREDSAAAGTVIGCDPGEGASVKAGSTVNIVISTGPAPTTTAAPPTTTAAPATTAPSSSRSESDSAGTTDGADS